MNDENNESIETPSGKAHTPLAKTLSFHEAIEMGEYQPEYLSNYPEWYTFSQHAKLQYIRKALDNRRHQLLAQWADINNALDFSLKPELHQALKNIENQLRNLEDDRERLYVEYTS